MTKPEIRVETLVGPTLRAMGYGVVRVRLTGNKRRTLQIMIERTGEDKITVEDCAVASQAISVLLDVEEPVHGPYQLEVSSPGIDRPLVKLADFERFAGFDARIETREPVDGRKRFRGRLLGVSDTAVQLDIETGSVAIALDDIVAAQLVLTDELIEATQKLRN